MFNRWFNRSRNVDPRNDAASPPGVGIRVVGVGGGGGNAVRRMSDCGLGGVDFLVLNTDVQALRSFRTFPTFAIGPTATNGMGSGGRPDVGRRAMRESKAQVARLLQNSDMVFIAAGLGGGTGTGAASMVADIARKHGALTVGVVTLPFDFEGPRRREYAEDGLAQLRQKVDTLIVVENDRLIASLNGRIELEQAFRLADETLRQGVQGVSDIVTVNGLINVDFADVKSVMTGGGDAFMALGIGEGRDAATQATKSALENPLFDAPLEGATGLLFNVTGGTDLTLGQVHEVADIIKQAASPHANVVFGVVQDKRMKRTVRVTLVGTGVNRVIEPKPVTETVSSPIPVPTLVTSPSTNGRVQTSMALGVRNKH